MKNILITYLLLFSLPLLLLLRPNFLFAQTNPVMLQRETPQNPEQAKEQLARTYYQSQEYEKALELFSQLYEKRPQQYYYTYYLNCLVTIQDYKEAEKLIKKQSKIAPSSFRYSIDEAWINKAMGNNKKASKLLDDIISALPPDDNLVIQIANTMQSKGFYQEALLVYQKARQAFGNTNAYNLEMANIYQFSGDYSKMFDSYLDYLSVNPQDLQRVKSQMQSMLRLDVDDNLSNILKTKLLEKTQAEPENLVFSQLLIWHAMQTKDFAMAFRQARAIDMRFNDHEEDVLEVANVAMSNNDFETALKAFEYVKNKKEKTPYYLESATGYYLALIRKSEATPGNDEKIYQELQKIGLQTIEELGLNTHTIPVALNLAKIKAFKLGEYDQAAKLIEKSLLIINLNANDQAELKLELANILVAQNKVWDASLLYAQIEADLKDEPIGHEAKFRNATLFYYVGEYGWAQTRLDILKSATSKLIANDAIELALFIKDVYDEDTTGQVVKQFGKADLMDYQGNIDSSFAILELIEKQSIGTITRQYVIYKKAGLMAEKQNYQQADSLYAYLVARFPESIKADNALFSRAELQRVNLNDEQTSMELYLFLMTNYPESIYANEARIRYRELRKDDPINKLP